MHLCLPIIVHFGVWMCMKLTNFYVWYVFHKTGFSNVKHLFPSLIWKPVFHFGTEKGSEIDHRHDEQRILIDSLPKTGVDLGLGISSSVDGDWQWRFTSCHISLCLLPSVAQCCWALDQLFALFSLYQRLFLMYVRLFPILWSSFVDLVRPEIFITLVKFQEPPSYTGKPNRFRIDTYTL